MLGEEQHKESRQTATPLQCSPFRYTLADSVAGGFKHNAVPALSVTKTSPSIHTLRFKLSAASQLDTLTSQRLANYMKLNPPDTWIMLSGGTVSPRNLGSDVYIFITALEGLGAANGLVFTSANIKL